MAAQVPSQRGCTKNVFALTFFWLYPKIVYRREIDDKCDGFWDGKCCTDELRDNQHIRLGLFRFPTSVARSGWHISYFMSLEKIQEKASLYHYWVESLSGFSFSLTYSHIPSFTRILSFSLSFFLSHTYPHPHHHLHHHHHLSAHPSPSSTKFFTLPAFLPA